MKIFTSFLLVFFFSINLFSQPSLYNKIKEMADSVSLQNISDHIKILEEAGGHYSRVTFTEGSDSAVSYIKNVLEKYSNLSVQMDTFFIENAPSPYNRDAQFNIIATIEGTNPNGYYLIGAHHDCSASREGDSIWTADWRTIKAPGADDNATGIALLLELARILSDTSFDYTPEYSIKLAAFAAEEYNPSYSGHHLGSIHYAENAKQNGDNILAMVSADMFGYNSQNDYMSIVANQNSRSIGEKFIEANNLFNVGLMIEGPPFVNAAYSDHDSFWDEGYKALLLIENAPPWNSNSFYTANPLYHTSDDSSGSVNLNLVKKVTQLSLASLASFASRLVVEVEDEKVTVNSFQLLQNYPNPFNPTTKIKFSIPSTQNPLQGGGSSGLVTLKVYDVLGNEVSTLVNEQKSPGEYEVMFDAASLSSGVYFYKLSAGNHFETKKMLLVQ